MNPYYYLNNLNKFGSKGGFKPGLQRVKALLSKLGHPEKKLSVIHVAGTNGKGSTISFIKSIYQQAGYRVGVFTSPALFKENEMIQINDNKIKVAELTELIKVIDPVIEEIKSGDLGQPSFFEVMTALAFLYFHRQDVDLALVEVGLGGELDATNVIEKPLVSVITSIGLEHTDILGNKLEDIARAKAGIIKKKSVIVTGVEKKEALAVIKKISEEKNVSLIQIDEKYSYKIENSTLTEQDFIVMQETGQKLYQIKLPGQHQIRNAVLAQAVVREVIDVFKVTEKQIASGLKEARLPGRIEIAGREPLILLDGAHNEEGIKSLVTFLKKQISNDQKLTLIISILKDKNIKAMLCVLSELNNMKLIITENKNRRAQSPTKIKKIADDLGMENIVYETLKNALLQTLKSTVPGEVICITGSLYTVAEAKILLKSF